MCIQHIFTASCSNFISEGEDNEQLSRTGILHLQLRSINNSIQVFTEKEQFLEEVWEEGQWQWRIDVDPACQYQRWQWGWQLLCFSVHWHVSASFCCHMEVNQHSSPSLMDKEGVVHINIMSVLIHCKIAPNSFRNFESASYTLADIYLMHIHTSTKVIITHAHKIYDIV